MVDNAAGGAMLERTADEVYDIFEMLGANSQQKSVRTKRVGVNEVVSNNEMAMQIAELTKQVKILASTKNYKAMRNNDHNPPQILRNQNQHQYQNQEPQYPRNQNPPFPNQGQAPQRKSSLEETLHSFMTATHDRMERNKKKTDSIEALVKRFIQIGQIAEADDELFDNNVENLIEKDSSYAGTLKEGGLVDVEITKGGLQKKGRIEPNLGQKEKDNEAFSRPEFHKAAEPYKPHIPFPNRLKESKQDKQFFEIFDMLSKVNINLPLLDVISNMSAYAKFFKELNSNKRRYENNEKVMVSETVSAVLQQQLPYKMKDPGSFTVDITMGDKKVAKAMLDLGASINLMPYSTYAQLGLGELKSTTMSLQLVDRSIKYPRGIVEDLLI
ncbi:uncharacterized protein LOC125369258 [Ricinus communis]|uniref:uncharacterized protein LOC125369258 n=1 Tax=Ricinus communis TaxID=3988 RepID=UPI00201AE8DF|nr:uncharacterized protein LOC125369258 [Ricinus communis]